MKTVIVNKFFSTNFSDGNIEISVEVDSKKVVQGTIFFALPGKKTHGFNYVEEAIQKGAILIVTSQDCPKIDTSVPIIYTCDPLKTLQNFAKFYLQYIDPLIVAVTGSCGKSTTKEFIAQLLSCRYKVGKTIGNQNSQVGLPLSILALKGDEQVLVLEMGMSEKGNISKLIEIAPPNFCVIRNIDVNHIEFFRSKIGIAEEKSSILKSKKISKAYIEKDAYTYSSIKNKCPIETYVFSIEENIKDNFLNVKNFSIPIEIFNVHPEHFIKNLIPAIAMELDLGVSQDLILNKIKDLNTLEHRFQIFKHKDYLIVDDSYNSSLASLKYGIEETCKQKVQGKKIAVIGAILEQGELENLHHQKIAEMLYEKFERVYCIGEPAKITVKVLNELGGHAEYADTLDRLACIINLELKNDDLVFLKGSNRFRLWELIDKLQ